MILRAFKETSTITVSQEDEGGGGDVALKGNGKTKENFRASEGLWTCHRVSHSCGTVLSVCIQ